MSSLAAFLKRDARLALTYPQGLVVPFVSIVFTVMGFAYLSRLINPHEQMRSAGVPLDYFSYVVLNLAFMLLLNGALQALSGAIRRDQVGGTLEPIVAAPAALPSILLASSVWPILFAAAEAAAYVGSGIPFGLRFHGFNAAAFVAVLVLSMACMLALGTLGAAAVVRYKQNPPSSFLTGSAVAMLSGVLFPVALLPLPLRYVSWMLPLTHALSGLRGAVSGAPLGAIVPDCLWLAVATALIAPVAFFTFAAALNRAKRDGTLMSY